MKIFALMEHPPTGRSRTVQARHRGMFRCSDEVLTRIWKVGQESFERSTISSFRQEQEPRRNWKEMRIAALARACLTGDHTFLVEGLCGMVPAGGFSDDHLHWLMAVSDSYRFTGDVRLIRELFPAVTQILGQLYRRRGRDGLLRSDESELAAVNSLCVGALRNVAEIAQAVGDDTTAGRCREEAGVLETAINVRLWDDTLGLYKESPGDRGVSQYANALTILFDVAPRERWVRMMLRMFDERVPDLLHASTPVEIFYLLGALYHAREKVLVLRLLREDRGAGEWLDRGGSSFVHSSSGPLYYLSSEILGVQPEQPGYRVSRIAPNPTGLLWAEGCTPTPYGVIAVRWERGEDNRAFMLETGFPWKAGGLIGIPRLMMKAPRVILNDDVIWSNEKFHLNEHTVTAIAEDDRIWFEVMGGKVYRFEVEG